MARKIKSAQLKHIRESIYQELKKRGMSATQLDSIVFPESNRSRVYFLLHGGEVSITAMAKICDYLQRPDLLLEYIKILKGIGVENKSQDSAKQNTSRREVEK